MRGGLDDALDKLARRDELRRRAAGEATGTPPAVTELVEAVAAVVAHHPELGVSVGVEGAGDPLLLHFYFDEGQVQVNAENAPAVEPSSPAPRHADFEVEVEEPFAAPPARDRHYDDSDTAERRYGSFDDEPTDEVGETSRDLGARLRDLGMATTRGSAERPPHPFAATPPPPVPPQTGSQRAAQDDAGRPTPPAHGYAQAHTNFPQRIPAEPTSPAHASFTQPMPAQPTSPAHGVPQASSAQPTSSAHPPAQPTSGAHAMPQARFVRPTSPAHAVPPQPRPPVPPQPGPSPAEYPRPDYNATRRINPEHYQAPPEASAADRIPQQPAPEQRNGMPSPLPHPIPLQVERPEETEMAARRLAALLRDDPTLLSRPPD